MTETTDNTITLRIDDEVGFRLREGRRPLVCPDTVTRVSYDLGLDVLHLGTLWAFGERDHVEALELDDGTIVAIDDIAPDSIIINTPHAEVKLS